MQIVRSVSEMQIRSRAHRAKGMAIGFVPTMGFLHEGHLSLMKRGRSENDLLCTSIFVNPTQFGPTEDYRTYPRDTASDMHKCEDAGVDLVFMPEADDMYGPDFQTHVEVERVSKPLCGAARPGHFRGVATVVLKLFNMVLPNRAYFGMKDYQQLQVIRTMVRDLNLKVEIVPCPTVREQDGLAMSSRNLYLSPAERRQAVCLYEALLAAGRLFETGETRAPKYVEVMSQRINKEPDAAPDYVSLVDPESLKDLEVVQDRCLAALAVRIGKTRLIDNMVFERSAKAR